ncbi:MAG: IS21 family transposase [Firmicutes bacterium]|nr:IS21 family transposase [Bacillota bacterium]
MRKIKEILRLYHEVGLSRRRIAESLQAAHSTVGDVIRRANGVGLGWPIPDTMTWDDVERLLYPGNTNKPRTRPMPKWEQIHRELKSKKSVTLQLLWYEYKQENPDGVQYSQFCAYYREWVRKLDVVMRQTHRAGEKMFVDFAGQTVPIRDRTSGEIKEAYVYVAVLGASNYTYSEATMTQDLKSWVNLTRNALEFFKGSTEIWIPDNLKTGVTNACRYEPDINPTYSEMAEHYGAVVIPTRPRKPRDKAKVEKGVQVVEQWILAAIRKITFFDLHQLNGVIKEKLDVLNNKPFQKMDGTRRSVYEQIDKPALKPLPQTPYVFARWKKATANIDYHISVDHNLYSVPYTLVGHELDVRLTGSTVEVFSRGQRVAIHQRAIGRGQVATEPSHRPVSHQKHLEWTPERMIRWAESVGPNTGKLVKMILERRPHPEQGYRSCLGIIRLAKAYSAERLEAAAARALALGGISYKSVKSILKNGLDQVPLPDQTPQAMPAHTNVRGPGYFN